MIQESKLLADIDLSSIQKLTILIKERYNYDFTNYALSSFKRRIARILEAQKMNHIDELIEKLESTPQFLSEFLTYLTVNVTEMFRDPTFWKHLKDTVLPHLQNEKRRLKIWHAGCSSGEEVYSMIILLKELEMINDVSIVATDMDVEILEKAKSGKYPVKNLTLNKQNYLKAGGTLDLNNYTTTDEHFFHIKDEVKQHANFKEHNLVTGKVLDEFDIILCRNVLIYFNQNLQNEVLKTIHSSLKINGLLTIGSKESLIWCDNFNKFNTVNLEEKIFKKILE